MCVFYKQISNSKNDSNFSLLLVPSIVGLNCPRDGLLGRGCSPQDDLVGEGDDGGGRLGRFQLAEHVALVVGRSGRSLGDEGEDAFGCGDVSRGRWYAPPVLIRVQAAEGHVVRWVVAPEEQLPGVVREGDALDRNLKVHLRGLGQWPQRQQQPDGLPDRLGSRE